VCATGSSVRCQVRVKAAFHGALAAAGAGRIVPTANSGVNVSSPSTTSNHRARIASLLSGWDELVWSGW
jgi:hypothetical protein